MPVSGFVSGFLESVELDPTAPSLIWRERPVSYRALHDAALRVRYHLSGRDGRSGGDGAARPVAVTAPKSPQAVALVLGAALAGRATLVPPAGLAPAVVDGLLEVAHGVGTVPGPSGPQHAALLLCTSGSTGVPKVVPLHRAAIDRFVGWAGTYFGLGRDTRALSHAPLSFDISILDVWASLAHGGCVVLADPERAADARYLTRLLRDERITHVQTVPTVLRLLLETAVDGLPDVRHVVTTGDAVPAATVAALPGLFPAARLHNVYGCTETNDSFVHEFAVPPRPGEELDLGRPLPGVVAVVLDDDGAEVTGEGEGELYVHTPFQTTGYLGSGGDDTLVDLPGRPQRFVRTGDQVSRQADGRLTLLGRNAFHVKIRGVRVSLLQIERTLQAHPEVREAVALALPDADGGRRLHAEVRRVGGTRLNSLTLRRFCRGTLRPADVPTSFHITEDPLPRTSTGKPDRVALATSTTGVS